MEKFICSKTIFVTPKVLKFGVYDAVANYNIEMKSSILTYRKINLIAGHYTINGLNDIKKNRIKWSIYRGNSHKKLRRQKISAKNEEK